jgi:3-deoxy-D-manno-octulosonic-acid transferase
LAAVFFKIFLCTGRRFSEKYAVIRRGQPYQTGTIVRTLYNILFTISFVLSAPYYFWRMQRRGHWTEGFAQRFGKYDARFKQSITNRRTLWLHAVSVGEVNLCTQLIRALEPRLPNIKIIVSTTTTTGMGELQKKLPPHIGKIYYPIDRRLPVTRALSVIHPEAIVLVEAEIWPNFLWRAQALKIPTFLVNARFSERSHAGYRRWGFFFRPIFAAFAGVGVQNQADAGRALELGCRPEAVRVVGNLKYDAAKVGSRQPLDVPRLLRQLGVAQDAAILVAGSTHAGEEALLAEQFLRLRGRHPNLFLILVPRHFERGRQVGKELEARGVKFVYRSEVTANSTFAPGDLQCLLVNSTGELRCFYEQATVVFVGKSLTADGGQNPIEPGELGRAMVYGPNMQNFTDIARQFVEQQGAVQVRNAAELEKVLDELIGDEARRTELGRNAVRVVRANEGGIGRTVEMILDHLETGGLRAGPEC